MQPVAEPEAHVLKTTKRGPAYTIEGVVLKNGSWLKAGFRILASECEHLDRDAFMAMAKQNLPLATEDLRYDEKGNLLT